MCEFKPGDEVVCVAPPRDSANPTRVGNTYVVDAVWVHPGTGRLALDLVGLLNRCSTYWGHTASRFRKAQRRNIQDWLKQETTYDEEQRNPVPSKPAKRKQRA